MAEHKTTTKDFGVNLDKVVNILVAKGKKQATAIVREATENLFTAIIVGTPTWFDGEEEGTARGSWVIAKDSPPGVFTKRQKNKGRNYVRTSLKGFALGDTWYMSNTTPYINVLEYGGYPKNVKQGSWSKNKKRFEIRSVAGYSKQAPEGMVRINIALWNRFIQQAILNRSKPSGNV